MLQVNDSRMFICDFGDDGGRDDEFFEWFGHGDEFFCRAGLGHDECRGNVDDGCHQVSLISLNHRRMEN